MPSAATIQISINGADDVKGAIGPRTFAMKLIGRVQNQELGIKILPSDVDKALILPALTDQHGFFVATDLAVSFKINAETVVRTLKTNGFMFIGGNPVITQLLFSGSGSVPANVYVFSIGD